MTVDEVLALAKTLVGKDAYEIASALIKLVGQAYRQGATAVAEGLGAKL